MRELTQQKLAVMFLVLDNLRKEEPEEHAEAVEALRRRLELESPRVTFSDMANELRRVWLEPYEQGNKTHEALVFLERLFDQRQWERNS